MNKYKEFKNEMLLNQATQYRDKLMRNISAEFMCKSFAHKYSYNFEAMGRPIIQMPQDIVALQEIIWNIKPDLIIETGIAHGGSLIMNASSLALLDICDAIESGKNFDPTKSKRKVVGIDVDIRPHNRTAIENHPMYSRIEMIEGSSTDPNIISKVKNIATDFEKVLVCLDSNHTHEHVISELNAYAKLVSVGSYCIVYDTIIEELPKDMFPDRPWDPGNNPLTAVREFLHSNDSFIIDEQIHQKLLISVAKEGYLKRIK